MIELITGVITDSDSHVLLARSTKHGWWEVPGTKRRSDSPEEDLSQALLSKLSIVVAPTEGIMPSIATVNTEIAGVDFRADVRRVLLHSVYARETEQSGYSEVAWRNPTHRNLGRIGLSPIAEKILAPFQDDPLWLQAAE